MSAQRSIAELLAGTPLFGALDLPLREAIAREMREARYAAGRSLFSRGDPGEEIHLVIEGRVRLSILTADGRELSFSHAVAGDVFGEIAVLDGSPRSADATALTEVRTMLLAGGAFHRLLEAHPPLARAAVSFLCARLREVSDHLEDIALFPIEARLARFLLNELSQRPVAAASSAPRVRLGMSQGELAMLLGASRPKVNTALAVLEEAGAIRRVGLELACDPEALAALARRE